MGVRETCDWWVHRQEMQVSLGLPLGLFEKFDWRKGLQVSPRTARRYPAASPTPAARSACQCDTSWPRLERNCLGRPGHPARSGPGCSTAEEQVTEALRFAAERRC